MDDRLIYFSSFHSLPFLPPLATTRINVVPFRTRFYRESEFDRYFEVTSLPPFSSFFVVFFFHLFLFWRVAFNGRFIHLVLRWQECAIFCNVIHFPPSELLMVAKKLLECCSNEEEIAKALISISPLEESNISGLKLVQLKKSMSRCIQAVLSFSKKKNLFLTSLIWKIAPKIARYS